MNCASTQPAIGALEPASALADATLLSPVRTTSSQSSYFPGAASEGVAQAVSSPSTRTAFPIPGG